MRKLLFAITCLIAICSCSDDPSPRPSLVYGSWQYNSLDTPTNLRYVREIYFNRDQTYQMIWYYQQPETQETVGFLGAASGSFTISDDGIYLRDGTYKTVQKKEYTSFEELEPLDFIYEQQYQYQLSEGGNKLSLLPICPLCMVVAQEFIRLSH